MMNNKINMLTVKDLQTELGIGRDSAYALVHNKSFPSIKIGGRYLVEKEALQHWLIVNRGREIAL